MITNLTLDTIANAIAGVTNSRVAGRGEFRRTRCPFHAGKSMDSLSLSVRGNKLLVTCHAGCGHVYERIQILMGLRRSDMSVTVPREQSRTPDLKIAAWLHQLWNESRAIQTNDPAHRYLTVHRRLPLKQVPNELRLHPACKYIHQDQSVSFYPTMLARVLDADSQLVALHRTFLSLTGEKARVPKPKKLTPAIQPGATVGGAIRLTESGATLGIAEGIETALSCHCDSGLPVWATMSASGMASVKIPSQVQTVVTFADNDRHKTSEGERAAYALAKRLHADGRTVKILTPPDAGTDWWDVLFGG